LRKKHNPGCPCCACNPVEDHFQRADDADLNAGLPQPTWTETAWSISSNTARTTSSLASAIWIKPGPDQYGMVRLQFKGANYHDAVRLILSYEDADNYVYGQFAIGGSVGQPGALTLWQVIAGTPTQLGSTTYTTHAIELDTWYHLQFCRRRTGDEYATSGETLTLSYLGEYTPEFATLHQGTHLVVTSGDWVTSLTAGQQHGFASGAVSAHIYVDDYLYVEQHLQDGADKCPHCDSCAKWWDNFDDNTIGAEWTESESAGSTWTEADGVMKSGSAWSLMTPDNPIVLPLGQLDGFGGRVKIQAGDTAAIRHGSNHLWLLHAGYSSAESYVQWVRYDYTTHSIVADGPREPVALPANKWFDWKVCGGSTLYINGVVTAIGPTAGTYFALSVASASNVIEYDDVYLYATSAVPVGDCRCTSCLPFSKWNHKFPGTEPSYWWYWARQGIDPPDWTVADSQLRLGKSYTNPPYNMVCLDYTAVAGWTDGSKIYVRANVYFDRTKVPFVSPPYPVGSTRVGVMLRAANVFANTQKVAGFVNYVSYSGGSSLDRDDYGVFYNPDEDNFSSYTEQAHGGSPPVSGDRLELELERTSATTATARVRVNGSLVCTATGLAFAFDPASGPGSFLCEVGVEAFPGQASGTQWSDFEYEIVHPTPAPMMMASFAPAPSFGRGCC
jgi:hypothetical protein